jgi:hypothetical protein
MALDPKARALLDQMTSLGGPPMHKLSVSEARKQSIDMAAMQGGAGACHPSLHATHRRREAEIIGINTEISMANYGADTALVTYTSRDTGGTPLAVGHGSVPAGALIADLAQPLDRDAIFFPRLVDGDGYSTSLSLINTSDENLTGGFQILDERMSSSRICPKDSSEL